MATKTLTLSTTNANTYALKNNAIYDGVAGDLYLGGDPGLSNANVNTWIPFFGIPFPKGKLITSATIYWIASNTNAQLIDVNIGCEAADNAVAPVGGADLNARALTTAFTNYVISAGWTAGVQYSFDVTAAVQEILNRTGWSVGNALAVFIKDNNTGGTNRRTIAANQHATYQEPLLQIVYPYFVPRLGGVI